MPKVEKVATSVGNTDQTVITHTHADYANSAAQTAAVKNSHYGS